ncbi:thioesterase family protein [Plantactinospora siamensis]|uniref:Thioesterase family protein n=1 Tax=Plantactinospora siamensis TaxID=555372 RepID=A0ABV6P5X9_9ACTN
MESLEQQTAVEQTAEGKYRGNVSEDWKLWAPVGGYLSGIALRAAQSASNMARPVSLTCHYLHEATFGSVDLEVTTLSVTERADSHLVRMTQNGNDILVALATAAPTDLPGPNENWQEAPEVTEPEDMPGTLLYPDAAQLLGDQPYWKMLEFRMVKGMQPTHAYPDLSGLSEEELIERRFTPRRDAHIRGWQRIANGEGAKDPWVDACRYLIICAGMMFPVVADPFTPPLRFIAPTLNLTVDFHTFHPEDQWLLADATGAHAGQGVLGADTRLWARSGDLLATAQAQLTYHDFSDPKLMERLHKSWFALREG